GESGAFAYCAAENRFDNNLVLVVGRNPAGEVNLGIGIPKGELVSGQGWPVTVVLDNHLKRDRQAMAFDTEFVVVELGKDEAFYNAMLGGRALSVKGPHDAAVFQLKGTTKALQELRKCVAAGGKGEGNAAKAPVKSAQPKPASEKDTADPPALPTALAEILKRAGLKDVTSLKLADMPREQRPADFAWRTGTVLGGLLESQVTDDRGLLALTTAYVETLKRKCAGAFTASFGDVETVNDIALRTGGVDCAATKEGEAGSVHVALLFYLTHTRLFEVFFHEAPEEQRTAADQARDALAGVIRQLAEEAGKKGD
ncbi:MAG TPA: hypothetical protein VEB64_12935, partial [Azospirillaceae bacterium]|nr:hypothetical protein [Azospirillaceae bacterium]